MRAFDRDLIRGGHYGQRSREPHLQAEHMAAPTNAANVKKVLANSEPSTHGTKRSLPGICRRTPPPSFRPLLSFPSGMGSPAELQRPALIVRLHVDNYFWLSVTRLRSGL